MKTEEKKKEKKLPFCSCDRVKRAFWVAVVVVLLVLLLPVAPFVASFWTTNPREVSSCRHSVGEQDKDEEEEDEVKQE